MLRGSDEGVSCKVDVAFSLLNWVLTLLSHSVRSGGRMSSKLREIERNNLNEVKSSVNSGTCLSKRKEES